MVSLNERLTNSFCNRNQQEGENKGGYYINGVMHMLNKYQYTYCNCSGENNDFVGSFLHA